MLASRIEAAAVLQGAVEDVVAVARQIRADTASRGSVVRIVVLDRLELGLDVADERQVGGLAFGVVGLAGHRDVPLDPFLRRPPPFSSPRSNSQASRSSGDSIGRSISFRYQGSICSQVLNSASLGSQRWGKVFGDVGGLGHGVESW